MLETVYAPTNEAFEVIPEKAADLVLNHGWTRSPTTFAPGGIVSGHIEPIVFDDPKPFSKRRPRKKVDLPVSGVED